MSTPHEHLPAEKRQLLRRAVRLQWVSIGVMAVVIVGVGLVAGQSQAMRTALAEDTLALLPPIVFLVGVWRTPHPLNEELWRIATHTPWVADAAVRLRDMGHVFHAEVFVVPTAPPTLSAVEDLTARLRASDWKTEDTVVVLTSEVPADIAGRSRPGE